MNKKFAPILNQFAKYVEKRGHSLSPEFLADKWIDGLDTLEKDRSITTKERRELEQGLVLSLKLEFTDKTGRLTWEN